MAAHYARRTGEDQDDLLQEAWSGLLEALPNMDMGIGCPRQYLISRARWRLLDWVRRSKLRRCVCIDDLPDEALHSASHESGLDDAVVSEFRGSLGGTQQAVLGYLMMGMTWREAGVRMGCTSANVAYHVRRIRQAYEEWSDAPLATGAVGATRSAEA